MGSNSSADAGLLPSAAQAGSIPLGPSEAQAPAQPPDRAEKELAPGERKRTELARPTLPAPSPAAARNRLPRALSPRNGEVFVAGMLGAVGLFFAWQAMLLDLGHIGLPGPGFFPLCLGATLVIAAVLIGLACWQYRDGDPLEFGHRDVLITLTALLILPLIFEPLGALLSLGLFGAAMLVLIGRVALPLAITASALGMAACWYFFEVLLGVSLPTGAW
jgi:hypothetical protein